MRLSTLIHELSHELSGELSAALIDALSAALAAVRSGRRWQLDIVVDAPPGSDSKCGAVELCCGGAAADTQLGWMGLYGGTISPSESIGGTLRRDPAGVIVLDPYPDG